MAKNRQTDKQTTEILPSTKLVELALSGFSGFIDRDMSLGRIMAWRWVVIRGDGIECCLEQNTL